MAGIVEVWAISSANPQRTTSANSMTRRRGRRSTTAPATAPNMITGRGSKTTAALTESPERVRPNTNATRAT